MAKVITDEQNYYDIADAIRGKLGVETLYLPSDMADAIESIETGTDLTSEDEGKVVVEDEGSYVLAEQTSLSVSQNGTYDTTTNDEVVVEVSGGSAVLVSKTITQNGTYDPADDQADGYSGVTVNVSGGGSTGYGRIYRIWTKSATSSEASVYVQEGYASNGEFVPTGERSELHFNGATKIETDFDLFKVTAYYNNDWNWNITAEADIIVEGNLLTDGDSAKTWRYNASVSVIIAAVTRLSAKTITQNGTYDPADDNADGYSSVTVNVSGGSSEYIEEWDLTESSVGKMCGAPLKLKNITLDSGGATFDNGSDCITVPMAWSGMTFEVDVASMQLTSGTHRRFIMVAEGNGLIYRSTGVWSFYNGSWADTSETDGSLFDGSTVKVSIDADGYWRIYKDGVLWLEPNGAQKVNTLMIGSTGAQSINHATISGIRILKPQA